jgi:hypothetical protein
VDGGGASDRESERKGTEVRQCSWCEGALVDWGPSSLHCKKCGRNYPRVVQK